MSLTEVSSVRVEHGQANKLLGNLWPAGNDESDQVTALENGPGPFLGALLSENALLRDGHGHDFLEDVSRESPHSPVVLMVQFAPGYHIHQLCHCKT